MSNIITEPKIKALVWELYHQYCKDYGVPRYPLKNVYVGRIPEDALGECIQIMGKSVVSISNEYLGTTHTSALVDTIKHELAHVFVGNLSGHGKKWREFAKKIGVTDVFY